MPVESIKDRNPEVDTALHIVKGAIVKVLRTPLTTSIKTEKNQGRIAVEYELPQKPTDAQIKEIEELANRKIKENLIVETFTMDRAEAEAKFKNNLVNETYIYDKVPVPAKITQVSIVHINEWNINCCGGNHVARTGDVKGIKIARINHREPKKELEFVIDVVPSQSTNAPVAANDQSSSTTTAVVPKKPVSNLDDTNLLTEKVINMFMNELKKHGIDLKDKETLIVNGVRPNVLQTLAMAKNVTYTKGFTAAQDVKR